MSEQTEVQLQTSPNFFHPLSGAPQLAGPEVGGDYEDCADNNNSDDWKDDDDHKDDYTWNYRVPVSHYHHHASIRSLKANHLKIKE